MVGVGKRKRDSLARCSIVDYHGNILYDRYVEPRKKVTDYRTRWSGILPEHMVDAIPFQHARKQILKILKNKIIVGHALHFDFKILKMRRSSHQIRDTSCFELLRDKANLDEKNPPSLRSLSKLLLYRDIQYPVHCSVEDSSAAMDLYRMVENEWELLLTDQKTPSVYFHDSFWPAWLHT